MEKNGKKNRKGKKLKKIIYLLRIIFDTKSLKMSNTNTIHSNKSLRSASQELWHTVEKEPTLNLRSASQELWHTEEKEPTPNLRSSFKELLHTVWGHLISIVRKILEATSY